LELGAWRLVLGAWRAWRLTLGAWSLALINIFARQFPPFTDFPRLIAHCLLPFEVQAVSFD